MTWNSFCTQCIKRCAQTVHTSWCFVLIKWLLTATQPHFLPAHQNHFLSSGSPQLVSWLSFCFQRTAASLQKKACCFLWKAFESLFFGVWGTLYRHLMFGVFERLYLWWIFCHVARINAGKVSLSGKYLYARRLTGLTRATFENTHAGVESCGMHIFFWKLAKKNAIYAQTKRQNKTKLHLWALSGQVPLQPQHLRICFKTAWGL